MVKINRWVYSPFIANRQNVYHQGEQDKANWGGAMDTIGKRVKALRTSKRLTQVGLAEMIGLKQSSIAYIENDRTEAPKGETLNGLCKALDTTPDFILYGSDEKDHENAMQEAELMSIWRKLSPFDRSQLLRSARGLMATTPPQHIALKPAIKPQIATVHAH